MNSDSIIGKIRKTAKVEKVEQTLPEIMPLNNQESLKRFWSEMLGDNCLYCSDIKLAEELRMSGEPVYSDPSILTMMIIGDGGYDIKHLKYIHSKFKVMADKYKGTTVSI